MEYLSIEVRRLNHLKANRIWRENNKEKFLALQRGYERKKRLDFPDKIKEIRKKEYLKHREKLKEKSRLWRLSHPEKVAAYNKKHYSLFKEVREKPRCIGCSVISEQKACSWCIKRYPHKYMNLLGKRVIFREVEERSKKSPILLHLPKEKSPLVKGEVIAAGNETNIKKGDEILIGRQAADLMIWENEDCFITLEENIIAK